MYVNNNRVSKYLKQKLLEVKGQMDKSIILAGDFNSNRQSEKKIGKGITADHYPQST